jgi:hypothetical protein
MNSRRFIAVAAVAAVIVLGLGLSCDKVGVPEIFGPGNGQGWQGAITAFKFLASGSGNVDIVVDWGDGSTDTLVDNSASDTVYTSHIWADAGDYKVKAMAMLTEKNDVSSAWSSEFAMTILPNDVPLAYFDAPIQAPVDVETRFTAWGVEPDGEDVSLMMRFGDEESDWSGYVPSGEPVTIAHEFKDIGETLLVSARAKDIHGAPGPWSAPDTIITVEAGGMLWWWFTPNEDTAPPITAPVIAVVEEEELVYVGSEDESYEIYGIDVSTGKKKEDGHGILPDEGYEWTTHPAYNWSTAHVLIAKEDGELYAFKTNLSDAWHYPGKTKDDDLLPWEWGNMCLAGNNIYIPVLDTIMRGNDTIRDVTKFYKITDTPNRPVNPPFTVLGVQTVLGAPVVDNASNVYFVTDSGNLFKMNSNIQVQWQKRVTAEKRFLYGPVIGAGGVVFCGDDSGNVHSYSPDGAKNWTTNLTGVREMYIVVGKQYLFAACDNGHVIALNPGGTVAWDSAVSLDGFGVYPVLAKNGYMYVVDDNTKLFCLVQATGAKLWDIACLDYFPGGARVRKTGLEEPPPSPAITSTGNIIVANEDALYCVSGYKDGTLDDGPWPKWQRDNYNTGRWAGF